MRIWNKWSKDLPANSIYRWVTRRCWVNNTIIWSSGKDGNCNYHGMCTNSWEKCVCERERERERERRRKGERKSEGEAKGVKGTFIIWIWNAPPRNFQNHFAHHDIKPYKKKVSASTNPTDRVLKRRPDTFFWLGVRYFLAPLRAWPVASSIATAREKSKGKNQAKGLGKEILTVTQAFDTRSRCVKRCATQYSIDATSVGCSKSCIIFAFCDFLLQRHIGLFLFFWLIHSRPANQLFLVYGEANGSICQVSRGQEAFFAEDVFCTRTRMPPCSRCCGLRLEIKSLWVPRFAF